MTISAAFNDDDNSTPEQMREALYREVSWNACNVPYALKLISDGARLDGSLLAQTAYYGHHTVIQAMLDKGLRVDAKDASGWTALMHAVRNNQFHTINMLLDIGADINSQDNLGNTPLLLAVTTDWSKNIVKLLLDRDADISIRNSFGNTPLDQAIKLHNYNDDRILLLQEKQKEHDAWMKAGMPLKRDITAMKPIRYKAKLP